MRTQLENPTIVLSNEIVFNVDDEAYIYQGLSGMIIALDPISEAIIHFMQKKKTIDREVIIDELANQYSRQEIDEAINELLEAAILYEQGEKSHPLVRTTKVPTAENLPIATLVLHLINSCNLGCAYCYAGDGEYGVPQKSDE